MVAEFVIVLTALPLFYEALVGGAQSVAVEGTLWCGNFPAAYVEVKLYDEDGADLDDLLASGTTDSRGFFKLSGYTDEMTTIDAKLNIYHDCNDGLNPCQIKLTFWIPDSYVSSGTIPSKVYNIGNVNLALKYEGEERDCMH